MADINFEDIQPFVEGQGDSGLTARQKIKRNFERVKSFFTLLQSYLHTKVDKDSSEVTTIKDASKYDTFADRNGNEIARIGDIDDVGKGIQAYDFFNANGESITGKISETEDNISSLEDQQNNFLPKNSSEEQILSDGSEAEYWVDKKGNIGMVLLGDGTLRVFKIETAQGDYDGGEHGKAIPNKIALPSNIYVLAGIQRNIWHQSVLARWNPYDYYLKFSTEGKGTTQNPLNGIDTASFQRRTNLVASIKTSNSEIDGTSFDVSLIDNRQMKVTQTKKVYLRIGIPNDENLSPIKVSFIGSSTVQLLYFEYALTHYVSNYTLIGLRHKQGSTTILHEGRGGASLFSYCEGSYNTGSTSHFFPFWQPIGNFRFWGATGFWINAHINADDGSFNNTGGYYTGLYVDSALAKFDASTGWLVNPTNGDIMYDTTTKTYKLYNGSEWVSTSKANYSWTFDYGKYLNMWGLDTPDVICITLGSNDFRTANLPLNLDTWKTRMDTVINSIHSVNASIKVVLCNQGPFSNHGYQGDETFLMNYKMWLHLDFMIKTYGERENENIFVLAQGSEISAEYGFNVSTSQNIIKPTEIYEGNERMLVHSGDVVHPYESLKNMGTPIAAFLQYIRKN